ncbi:MAG: hypothetical protein J4432_01580 [DPANN group archaeon]|nr:hypothetical protein [DPANN group archaeon]
MTLMVSLLKDKEIIHYPNLKTVLIVEEILKKHGGPITRAELKRRLRVSIMHQTLNVIIRYLVEKGMVYDSRKGIIWLEPPSRKLKKLMDEGLEV